MAIAHFAVGCLATILVCAVVAPRYARSPTVVLGGGIWGVLPDAHWVLPVGSDIVRDFHATAWANMFWFHHLMDTLDPYNSRVIAAWVVILSWGTIAVIEYAIPDFDLHRFLFDRGVDSDQSEKEVI